MQSYLGLLEEENIVNDMNHMNVGKNERSSQGLVNYINFFRQLANYKYFSTFYSQYYLNYYNLFFLYIFWNSGTRIQILQNITAIILNSLGVQNQKIKMVFRLRPFSLLNFSLFPLHCWFFIVGIFIVAFSLSNFHCRNFHCQIFIVAIFIVKFSLLNFFSL